MSMATSRLEIDDWVEITDDIDIVQQLQKQHGGWDDRMQNILGRTGKVVEVLTNGDLRVRVDGNTWTLNPVCCALSTPPQTATLGTNNERDRILETLTEGVMVAFFEMAAAPLAALMRPNNEPHQQQSAAVRKTHADNSDNRNDDLTEALIRDVLCTGTSINAKDEHGNTALHRAVLRDENEAIRVLLDNGAAINEKNALGRTALHLAVEKRSPSSVSILLQRECDVNIEDSEGNTSLHKAVEAPHAEVTEKLVNHECANHGIKNKLGFNVLQYAASCGNAMVVRSMLPLTPHLTNLKTTDGMTPLHLAVVYDHSNIAEMLIAEGKADTELRNEDGLTPLLLAVSLGHQQIACVLVERGANISAQDNEGNTCLHYAAKAAHKSASNRDLLCYLLNKGADISKMNHAGQCSIDVASTDEVKNVLLEHVPDQGARHAASRNAEVAETSKVEPMEPERPSQGGQVLICDICSDRRKDTVLDCGHALCNECARKIQNCAVCRKTITKRLPLFL